MFRKRRCTVAKNLFLYWLFEIVKLNEVIKSLRDKKKLKSITNESFIVYESNPKNAKIPDMRTKPLRVIRICSDKPIIDADVETNFNINLTIETEDNQIYTLGCCTPEHLMHLLTTENRDFLEPFSPQLIIKEIGAEVLVRAIEAFCEFDGKLLKEYFLAEYFGEQFLNKKLTNLVEARE